MAAQRNPFNPDGTWRWEINGEDIENLGIKAKAGKRAEEPWNQWQSQKSPEELEAYNQWKKAYVKFNEMTTAPGENWFRQEWDRNVYQDFILCETDAWYFKKSWEERLAYWHWLKSTNRTGVKSNRVEWAQWAKGQWEEHRDRPDAWKELLKQAERNRQQQKQERTWGSYGRAYGKSYRDIFEEWNARQHSRPKLTQELARALILSNLDKFDVHYAEYWQRQRRMQMNEAKSKIGQLSIVHVPTVHERFMHQCRQTGATEYEAAMLAETVWPPLSYKNEAYDNFVSRVMSPLFKWNHF